MNSQTGSSKSLKYVSLLSRLLEQKLQSLLSFCPMSKDILLGFFLSLHFFPGRKDMDTE